jgi:N-methylhydantoinase A/oxoprolinase/acetone carboxylase beta subunit
MDLSERFPDTSAGLSSRVGREIREHERMSTRLANAYAPPLAHGAA